MNNFKGGYYHIPVKHCGQFTIIIIKRLNSSVTHFKVLPWRQVATDALLRSKILFGV